MGDDFFEAQLREAYAKRKGIVLDADSLPDVVEGPGDVFQVGDWLFSLDVDGDATRVLKDLRCYASWYRFLISKQTEQRRVTG